ncbi:MAG: HEPN domain-containing protein [Chloroflexi bacterium]|nr:HEPN domain-containing protein [Chloroflexota bacterium]
MNPTPGEQLIQVRIQQANDSLEEADTLYRSGLFRGAINRAYYAMFYAILALAVQRQATTSKHSGAIAFFDRELIKSGILPRELSRSLHLAFQRRQETDYGDIGLVNNKEAGQALLDARIFVGKIEGYLDSIHG